MMPPAVVAALLAATTVVAVAVSVTAARGHGDTMTIGGRVGLLVLAGLGALSAWAVTATWADWGGWVCAAVLTVLWSWAGYYTLDAQAPPGISQRLHELTVRSPFMRGLFLFLMLLFIAHILMGWP